MLNVDFNDFFDSDDDAFLAEVSNSLPDCDFPVSASLPKVEKNSPTHERKSVATSSYFECEENISSYDKDINLNSKKITSYVADVKITDNVDSTNDQSESCNTILPSNISTFIQKTSVRSQVKASPNITFESDSAPTFNKSTVIPKTSSNINKPVNTNAVKSSSCALSLNHISSTPESSYINNRFTPGFTPKAKKRKFPGPAGLLEVPDGSNSGNPVSASSKKISGMDTEFEHIASSQFSTEYLTLPSWQKLQMDVSSHSNLHSMAKFYSIQRVLQESSKKKLPKHMVVPVLCVLLKEMKHKGSSTGPLFMDDTGEIHGKIDADVLSKYKEYMVEGTALILKKVTFLCNMLILKADSLVSMYMRDGTENHLQSLEYVLDKSEPLKPMNCECLKRSHTNRNSFPMASCTTGTTGYHKSDCVNHGQNVTQNENIAMKNVSSARPSLPLSKPFAPVSSSGKVFSGIKKSGFVSNHQNVMCNASNQGYAANSNASTSRLSSPFVNKPSPPVNKMRSDEALEDLLSEENDLDEFDELLGNLDEKSFMDGM